MKPTIAQMILLMALSSLAWGQAVATRPAFTTSQETTYRRNPSGYTLWSVGFDEHDDGGTKDDIAITVEH